MKKILLILTALIGLTLPITAQTLNSKLEQAQRLNSEKKYDEALSLLQDVASQTKQRQDSTTHRLYVESNFAALDCYENADRYKEAYALLKGLLKTELNQEERKRTVTHLVYNGYLYASQLASMKSTEFAKARRILEEIRPYADEQMLKRINLRFGMAWYYDGVVHDINQETHEAVACFSEARQAFHQYGLIDREIDTLHKLAVTKNNLLRWEEALSDLNEALQLAQAQNDEVRTLKLLTTYWKINKKIGAVEVQNRLIQQMDSVIAQTGNPQVKIDYYIFRGKEASDLSNFHLAGLYFLKTKDIIDRIPESEIGALRQIYHSNLRDLYVESGEYDKALVHNRQAYDCYQDIKNESRDKSYIFYLQAAHIYACKNDRENCFANLDTLFLKSRSLQEPQEQSLPYIFRAQCHTTFKEYDEALSDYHKADSILAQKYDLTDATRYNMPVMLAGTEYQAKLYPAALKHISIYVQRTLDQYGPHSIQYVTALIRKAKIEALNHNKYEGCEDYKKAVTILKSLVRQRLLCFSTAEREHFWNNIAETLTEMTSYAFEYEEFQSSFTTYCYDALVLTKSFLLQTECSLYDALKRNPDPTVMSQYSSLIAMKQKIKNWEKDYPTYADSIIHLAPQIQELDKQLSQVSQTYDNVMSFMDIDYDGIKKHLGKHEVLFDFTDFVSKGKVKHHAVYIIKKEQQHPLLKSLFTADQTDSLKQIRPDMYYEENFVPQIQNYLWNPLREYVDEGDTIYYVPSPFWFQFNLESLPLSDGSLLGDHYHFVRLSSVHELKNQSLNRQLSVEPRSAILYGGLQYDVSPEVMKQNAETYRVTPRYDSSEDLVRGDSIFYNLPGSKTEVERIRKILQKNDFKVQTFTEATGTEESFLHLNGNGPQILHLATHGFYYTPEKAAKVNFLKGHTDAMLLSGLIMSGGNTAWRGNQLPEGVLSGILTADIISKTDLAGTELVVLSACQSGQGHATSEGLYGLQRAFKKAGAGTMIMTLWNISDQKSMEFMVLFYECLASKENHWDKRKAFEQARQIFRKKYNSPYYWAGFIMLD